MCEGCGAHGVADCESRSMAWHEWTKYNLSIEQPIEDFVLIKTEVNVDGWMTFNRFGTDIDLHMSVNYDDFAGYVYDGGSAPTPEPVMYADVGGIRTDCIPDFTKPVRPRWVAFCNEKHTPRKEES